MVPAHDPAAVADLPAWVLAAVAVASEEVVAVAAAAAAAVAVVAVAAVVVVVAAAVVDDDRERNGRLIMKIIRKPKLSKLFAVLSALSLSLVPLSTAALAQTTATA